VFASVSIHTIPRNRGEPWNALPPVNPLREETGYDLVAFAKLSYSSAYSFDGSCGI
jgi:hypothetical protein